jgi:hypothetical protein
MSRGPFTARTTPRKPTRPVSLAGAIGSTDGRPPVASFPVGPPHRGKPSPGVDQKALRFLRQNIPAPLHQAGRLSVPIAGASGCTCGGAWRARRLPPWADSAPTGIALGRTAVRAVAAVPSGARDSLHHSKRAFRTTIEWTPLGAVEALADRRRADWGFSGGCSHRTEDLVSGSLLQKLPNGPPPIAAQV